MIREFASVPSMGPAAQRWLDGERGDPAVPQLAATVLLVQDAAAGGVEVFMLHRPTTMAFAPDVHVFPGGRVDPRDADTVPWLGPSREHWARQLGTRPEPAGALVCAAVRETFEECGVLLAGPDSSTVVGDVSGEAWEQARRGLQTEQLGLAEVLTGAALSLRTDLLSPWAHWITPEFQPTRFDTHFFLARHPQDQQARHLGEEAQASVWWRPAELLEAADAGTAGVLPPTRVALEELAGASDVAALFAAERTPRTVTPWIEQDGDRVALRVELS